MNSVEFGVAEVLSYDYTYNYFPTDSPYNNTNSLFSLKVRLCGIDHNSSELIVKPSNIKFKQIPLVGEFILMFKTLNQQSTSLLRRHQWYYISTIDLQSSINENMSPGLSGILSQDQIDNVVPGETFNRKSISALQPYEGDYLFEGRNGNSIRFSSTINITKLKDKYYNKLPSWSSSSDDSNPITIISNGRKSLPNKEFIVENIIEDNSSIYLTSTQNIPNLKLGNTNSPNSLSKFLPNESQFANSQFIGIADRVILKAKTDVAIIDSPVAIILNTTGDIKLGSDSADVSLVHGDVLLNILQKILNQLGQPIQCGTNVGTFIDSSNITAAQTQFKELLSSTYFMNKNTY